ncbi:hypothetical protein HPB48_025966 [Haemaphysalis longicornis]|uniref:MOSC domain-containing protein n=1 Tax=Haemaphysalis longicornis TaxID=44386 RepID=A0A9J6HB44_HAELO|nr:hypothetical protein HPB48_025966 [Haemaphysalis longicornis]
MVALTLRAPQVGTIAATAAAAAGAVVAYLWLRLRASARRGFVPVGRLANLFIYPIKSIAGIEVPYADCTVTGPVYQGLHDRLMLVVKGDYFVSMREEPRLGLIRASFEKGQLKLTADGHPPLVIDVCDRTLRNKPSFTVRMRTFSYNAVEVSAEASQWFRDYLQSDNARLVRILLDQDALDRGKNCPTPVACQDESAFHVLSKASLDGLLSRLPPGSNIGRDNFRPAFFVDDCEAHAEASDHWERVRIGDAEQAFSHRTTRCLLTTVDQVAAVRTDKEPLTTLRKVALCGHPVRLPCSEPLLLGLLGRYRVDQSDRGRQRYQSQPLLGISTYHIAPGRITVGDTVYAQVSPEPLL